MIKSAIILPDGTEISSGHGTVNALKDVAITECVNRGQELTIGSVCASMLEATLIAPLGELSVETGSEVTLYSVDDSGNREKCGIFILEKPTRISANNYRLTAYDRVSRLDKDLSEWLSDLPGWPYELYTFASMVCDACGLTLKNQSLPNEDFQIQQFSADGITGRQLLSWVGEATAMFCRATVDGELEFAWYNQTAGKIGPTSGPGALYYLQGALHYEDYQVAPVEKVQIQYSDQDVGVVWPDVSGEANTYKITGNYLLVTDRTDRLLPVAKTVYAALSAVTYTPCSVTIPESTAVKPGDILEITDANGHLVQMYVMSRKRSGHKDTLEATGSQRRDSSTAVNNQSFKALSGKILNLQTSVEGLRVENAAADGRLSKIEMDVDGISSSVSVNSNEISGILEEITQIRQTASSISIQINSILENGVNKVKTTMGYTFDNDGMHISKSGEEMDNTLTHRGMYVKRNDETILQADADGVIATDVTIRHYMILGEHARFEDYSDAEDPNQTACYFI